MVTEATTRVSRFAAWPTPTTLPLDCPVRWCPDAPTHAFEVDDRVEERWHRRETLYIEGPLIDTTNLPESITSDPAWRGRYPGLVVAAEVYESDDGPLTPVVEFSDDTARGGIEIRSWDHVEQVITALREAATLAFGEATQ